MISPQGYSLGEEPKSKNPFWDGSGEDSDVNRIYATATVDDQVGTPSVQTTKSIDGHDITFGFNFHNLKGATGATGPAGATGDRGPAGPAGATGERGPAGPAGATGERGPAGADGQDGQDGVSPTIDVVTVSGGHRVDITDAQGSESFTVLDGAPGAPGRDGTDGTNGQDGVTPDITMTATADATASASPTVTVTKGGTTANPTFALAFSGLKGETGATGATGPAGERGPAGQTGATGPAGPGVPAGGTAGQVLAKVDGTDYNTEWITPSGGGGGYELLKAYVSSSNMSFDDMMADLINAGLSGGDLIMFMNTNNQGLSLYSSNGSVSYAEATLSSSYSGTYSSTTYGEIPPFVPCKVTDEGTYYSIKPIYSGIPKCATGLPITRIGYQPGSGSSMTFGQSISEYDGKLHINSSNTYKNISTYGVTAGLSVYRLKL